ncbi:MAG TPA: helix-turn-helix domain-containing protein [Magnetospirillum sp.]|nr:helix-turn-helix domain-containing protein [Magnetospirillum sp.]
MQVNGTTANDNKIAFSVEDFCSAFSIGRTALYAELKAGRLKASKCGRRTLIPRVEAERWLSSLPAA